MEGHWFVCPRISKLLSAYNELLFSQYPLSNRIDVLLYRLGGFPLMQLLKYCLSNFWFIRNPLNK
jgi:hypothetical protein